MYCEHAFDTPVEMLVLDEKGCALCPRCAAYCRGCGLCFHIEDLDHDRMCHACAATQKEEAESDSQAGEICDIVSPAAA